MDAHQGGVETFHRSFHQSEVEVLRSVVRISAQQELAEIGRQPRIHGPRQHAVAPSWSPTAMSGRGGCPDGLAGRPEVLLLRHR